MMDFTLAVGFSDPGIRSGRDNARQKLQSALDLYHSDPSEYREKVVRWWQDSLCGWARIAHDQADLIERKATA